MNNYKKLINNSLIFAIGNFGSKLIVLFLVPLYTYYLTPSEYGTSDIILSIVSLLTPVITLSVFDAVLRFVMENKESNKNIFTNGFIITVLGNIIFMIITPLFLVFGSRIELVLLMISILFSQSFQSLLSQFTRSIGKVKLFAFNGILTTLSLLISNLIFLVLFNKGLIGYLISQVISLAISNIYLFIKLKAWRLLSINYYDGRLLKMMLLYSLPLMPNALMCWLTNTSNRFFILYFLGASTTGLFAVANKIPSILSIVQSVFFQAWQMSAIETYNQKNSENFYSNVFLYFSIIMILSISILLIMIKPIFIFFISSSFFESWRLTPFLLIAVMFSSFSSFLGTNYIASKETKGILYSTILGAFINIFLSLVLINLLGANGAGIATTISFLSMWIYRYIDTQKYIQMSINWKKLLINLFLLFIQIALFYSSNLLYNGMMVLILLIIMYNNRCELLLMGKKILGGFK
ncbi:oligosaccharide flippase family protein [Vagococcus lutrae]|uniref:oligosaccharide flippase family protein n=1 Tax=Vagococcus lutrae TaxID=81947 RepID=UPI00288EE3D4|nr:polysaccharide biosynthesis C-terminal domain-containing protein [Vagococcus lutrae]MDT2802007.1 oligosaccharide flippase family protein [Vagococcus lutrae]